MAETQTVEIKADVLDLEIGTLKVTAGLSPFSSRVFIDDQPLAVKRMTIVIEAGKMPVITAEIVPIKCGVNG